MGDQREMRRTGPNAPTRIGVVLLLIAMTLVTPESAQLFVVGCLAALVAADLWRERRGVRRLAFAATGLAPGRHRPDEERTRAVLR